MKGEHWLVKWWISWAGGGGNQGGAGAVFQTERRGQRRPRWPRVSLHKHAKVSQSVLVALRCVELQNQNKESSGVACFLNVTEKPFWKQEMKCVCLSQCVCVCACGCVCLPGIKSHIQRWVRQRFNYPVIECDSLITKGEMWGLISTPEAAGSAKDDHTNRYL